MLNSVELYKQYSMNKTFKGAVIAVICAMAVNPVFSQDGRNTLAVPEVTVTAPFANQYGTEMVSTFVPQSSVSDGADVELISALSKRVPGMFATERGVLGYGISAGSAGKVTLRGVGGNNTNVLFLIDGEPQFVGIYGHAITDLYLISDIASTTVTPVPQSVIYGTNAMGGAVNMSLPEAHKDGATFNVSARYGSYNTNQFSLNNTFKVKKVSGFFALTNQNTEGYRPNSAYTSTGGVMNLAYKASDHFKLKFNTMLTWLDAENPGKETVKLLNANQWVWRGSSSLTLENNYTKYYGFVRIFGNWGIHRNNDGYMQGTPPKDLVFRSKDYNCGVKMQESFLPFEGNTITVGLDYSVWGGKARNTFSQKEDMVIIERTLNDIAPYLTIRQKLFSWLELDAGLRYNYNTGYGSEWVPSGAIVCTLPSNTGLSVNIAKGFRAPNIKELYIDTDPNNRANPFLDPESMVSYDFTATQGLWDSKIKMKLSVYLIKGKNSIVTIDQRLTNSGKFTNYGTEFSLSVTPVKNLMLSGNYSYLHTDIDITAAPTHKIYAECKYLWKKFTFDVNTEWVSGLFLSGKLPRERYTLLNAHIARRIDIKNVSLSLFVSGDNLTNVHYYLVDGFPMAGVVVMGGANLRF